MLTDVWVVGEGIVKTAQEFRDTAIMGSA